MREVNENFHLVPPHIHLRNSEEQAIRTLKEHFISILSSSHKYFPFHIWYRLLPHVILTLNLLRQSRMNPKLSGYTQLHGEFNYDATPLAPPGTQVIIHGTPTVRGTWESHGLKGFYLGPSMNHYRCHLVYVTKTRGERDSDCVEFSPHNTPLPYSYSSENAIIAACELAYVLKNPAPQAPNYNIGESQIVAIQQISKIFSKAVDNVKSTVDPPQQQPEKNRHYTS